MCILLLASPFLSRTMINRSRDKEVVRSSAGQGLPGQSDVRLSIQAPYHLLHSVFFNFFNLRMSNSLFFCGWQGFDVGEDVGFVINSERGAHMSKHPVLGKA